MLRNILISIGVLTLYFCKFIPLTITILLVFVVTIIMTANEIINDPEGKNENLKYLFAVSLYALAFALIYFYMKFNNLEMGEFTFF
ncbi:hypothetical protein [uncultured Chryseobacterium sp.]|uniref:hypothetical protein n=1 Tax=uncultured Chryseobacterium sp. TaxID=259322 RepID=UPI00262460F4|nr:hypothetical protein [uncultured Chryseobacterium sp.]